MPTHPLTRPASPIWNVPGSDRGSQCHEHDTLRTPPPIRGTKTGKPKRLPVGELLGAWLDRWVDPADRLTRAPVFLNPRTGRRWTHWALRDTWVRAARAAGLEGVELYEGRKHSIATDAIRRGVSERALQSFLGHRDLRSTRRYAPLSDQALVPVPRRPFVGGLSVAPHTVAKPEQKQGALASPAGFEPAGFVRRSWKYFGFFNAEKHEPQASPRIAARSLPR